MEKEGETPQTFDDNREQYAFRKEAGNLLLKDPTKMGVVLFDVYMPNSEEEEATGGTDTRESGA